MPFALQSYMICPENIRKPNITKFIVIAHDTILYHLFFLFFLWNLDFFWYISVNASNTPWYRPYTRYCIASPCQIPITNILIMKPTDAVVSRVLNLFFFIEDISDSTKDYVISRAIDLTKNNPTMCNRIKDDVRWYRYNSKNPWDIFRNSIKLLSE